MGDDLGLGGGFRQWDTEETGVSLGEGAFLARFRLFIFSVKMSGWACL